MVDEARGNLVQRGIDKGVRANHHRIVSLAEHVDHLLQGAGAAVKIIRIKLHGITAASFGMKSLVPAATDAEIGPHWDDMLQVRKLSGEIGEDGCCPIGRVVVHNNDIEWRICFLQQGAFHSPGNRFFSVPHGDDDRGLHREGFRCLLNFPEIGWQIGPNLLQVVRENNFHFLLNRSILGIDIRKYLVL